MGWMDRLFGGAPDRKDSATGKVLALRSVGRPTWMARNFQSFAKEGYGQNVIAYRCIRLIAENVASVPVDAFEGEVEKEGHDALRLLLRPNPWQSGEELLDALVTYLKLSGSAFLEPVIMDGRVRELYALRPDRMRMILGPRGYPVAWEYEVNSQKVRFDVPPVGQAPILHIREFNPLDDWGGLSPVEAAAFAIDVHNAAGGYNKALLDNAASPSGALVYEGADGESGTLTDQQFARLKKEMEERYTGPKNAGRPMLLDGGLKWQAMGMSPRELEFVTGKREAAREIALAFGVPPMLLGIPGDNTYSNYQEARAAFWEETVLPLAGRIFGALSNFLQPTYPNLSLRIDLDRVEALAPRRAALWDRVSKADFLTLDEKRAAVGYEPYVGGTGAGEQILVSGTMMPLDEVGFAPGGGEPNV